MEHRRITSIVVLALAFLITSNASLSAEKRSLTRIDGDLYRFQNNFHFSVVLVTDEGVMVTDPINKDAAQWLKDEIASRFPFESGFLEPPHGRRRRRRPIQLE